MLWRCEDIMEATGGIPSQAGDGAAAGWMANGISIDSRTTMAGDLFIALHGVRHDGHEHITEAAGAGAVAAMIARPVATPIPALLVEDTITALTAMAEAARRRGTGARRIAITGSVGKTGTRHVTEAVLAAHAKTHASSGNLNNHIGTPLSLARMPADAGFGIFEIGMNHSGEIAALSPLVAPHYAVITRIANSHIGHFDSVEDIADAKAEIFTGLAAGGVAVLNADDGFTEYLTTRARAAGAERIITIGRDAAATYRIMDTTRMAEGLRVEAMPDGDRITFDCGMTGTHNAHSALVALAIADAESLPRDTSLAALAGLTDLDGRGRHHKIQYGDGRAFTLIDDSYNASPASMQAAIADLATDPAPGRRVAILADMLELGEAGETLHRALAPALKAAAPGLLICFGEGMRALAKELRDTAIKVITADDADSAGAIALAEIRNGDVVLIKGSNGMHTAGLVRHLLRGQDDTAPAATAPVAEKGVAHAS